MKKTLILLVALTLVILTGHSFVYAQDYNNLNPLKNQEIKQFQSKKYNNISSYKIIKSIINILQDECYFIEDADSRIGFILATKEFDTKDKSINLKEEFGARKFMTIVKLYSTSRTEANVSITPSKNYTEVKIIFRRKIINIFNANKRVKNLTDEKYYDEFFTKLDAELKNK